MDLGLYPDIPNIEITTSAVNKILEELDPSKSPGPDKIPSRLLKSIATDVLAIPLSYIIILGFLNRGSSGIGIPGLARVLAKTIGHFSPGNTCKNTITGM